MGRGCLLAVRGSGGYFAGSIGGARSRGHFIRLIGCAGFEGLLRRVNWWYEGHKATLPSQLAAWCCDACFARSIMGQAAACWRCGVGGVSLWRPWCGRVPAGGVEVRAGGDGCNIVFNSVCWWRGQGPGEWSERADGSGSGVKLLEPERESPNCAGGAGEQEWRRCPGVVVLHIHPGVLVGPVASFQRFPVIGGGGGQDECATRAPLHIHPALRTTGCQADPHDSAIL